MDILLATYILKWGNRKSWAAWEAQQTQLFTYSHVRVFALREEDNTDSKYGSKTASALDSSTLNVSVVYPLNHKMKISAKHDYTNLYTAVLCSSQLKYHKRNKLRKCYHYHGYNKQSNHIQPHPVIGIFSINEEGNKNSNIM